MNKCQHGKAISKFCLFEHCQSKEPGGCDDCIKKYHNHIGQISFLNEDDIINIIKKFHIEPHNRPKSRSLQQSIFNFLTHVKTTISINLDLVCKNLINQIGYPFLQKNGTLNCYKRLKNKEYRKVSQKQLKELWELFKTVEFNQVVKEEKLIYCEAVVRIQESIQKMQKNINQAFDNIFSLITPMKSNLAAYDRTMYLKINDIFKELRKYPNLITPQTLKKKQTVSSSNKEPQKIQQNSNDKKKTPRDVSLDRTVKISNNLKNLMKSKTQEVEKDIQTDNEKQLKEEKYVFQETIQIVKKLSLQQEERGQKKLAEREAKRKKTQKYSADLKSQDVVLRPLQKMDKAESNLNDFSQKEEEILQRKKKLLDLMNSKPTIKKQVYEEKIDKNETLVPVKEKPQRPSLNGHFKNTVASDRLNIASLTIKPIKVERERSSFSIYKQQDLKSKRVKSNFDDQLEHITVGEKKITRNETCLSSDSQVEVLFHANANIPIDDTKQQDEFQINQESVQKCIVVPEVDILAAAILNMHTQCQSPLLRKKKEIQKFSALAKLAESKILQQEPHEKLKRSPQKQVKKVQNPSAPSVSIGDSFIKIKRILDSDVKQAQVTKPLQQKQRVIESQQKKKSLPKPDPVQINQSQQQSLALLLKSLKLPASQAIPYLQKSLQFSSNNLSAAEYLSYLYLQAQRPQDCLKLCNDILKSISSSQNNQLALRLNINKSAALNHLGRYSQCITFLQRCLRYRHNDLLYKNLADAYCSIGILQKAIYNYEHAIIENATNTQAHYNLSVCHYQQENYYNASIYVDKALKHQPTNQTYKQMKKHIDEKILANPVL